MITINYLPVQTAYSINDICAAFSISIHTIYNIINKNNIECIYDTPKDFFITSEGLTRIFSILKHSHSTNIKLSKLKDFISLLDHNALNEDNINRETKQIILNM